MLASRCFHGLSPGILGAVEPDNARFLLITAAPHNRYNRYRRHDTVALDPLPGSPKFIHHFGRPPVPNAILPGLHGPDGPWLRRRSFSRHLCCDADLGAELIERIWQDPHGLLADGHLLQHKVRCTVVRLDHPAGPLVWKHHNWGTPGRTLRRSLSKSCARKSWTDANFLHAAGVPTPRPRAFFERRFGPFKTCSYQLTDYVPGTSLYRFLRFERPSTQVVGHLARQVAAIWQRLDDLRVCHNDLKTENLLVDPQGKVWLIDVDRLRRCRDEKTTRRRQLRDAGDLLHPRNWRANPQAAEIFRREILRTPAGAEAAGGPQGAAHPLNQPVLATNRPSQLVTVLIPCRNAAATISACLESVRDMADEILVADAGSTDETLRLVREFGGCRIIEKASVDPAAFEAWAHGHARHAWILRLLPGEQLSPELGRAVQDRLAADPAEHGFRILRRARFRGQYLQHGEFQPDCSLRLYRKDAARYEMRDSRVEVTVPSGKIGNSASYLVYEAFAGLQGHFAELVRHAASAAASDRRQGRRSKLFGILWRAPWRFLQSYVLRFGWLDGRAGLHASCLSAVALYLREAMLWEIDEPHAARSAVARDRGQDIRLFDPQGHPDTVASAKSAPPVILNESMPHDGRSGEQQMRPAA
jgi:hypothetical protein